MRFASDGRFFLNGEDVTSAIRTPDVDAVVSRISVWKSVRSEVTRHQRRIAATGNVVVEGRDVTTVVFPQADVKFFVTASVEERARRRFIELRERGENVDVNEIASEIRLRDERDATRHESPMRVAEDAIVVDTTGKTPDEVVALMAETIAERTR
jgi:cytidylate kinase